MPQKIVSNTTPRNEMDRRTIPRLARKCLFLHWPKGPLRTRQRLAYYGIVGLPLAAMVSLKLTNEFFPVAGVNIMAMRVGMLCGLFTLIALFGTFPLLSIMTQAKQRDHKVCLHCLYDLRRLPDKGTCPECGNDYDRNNSIAFFRSVGWRRE